MTVVNFPNQVNQSQQSLVVQDNLGKMLGRVQQWNPDAPSTEIRKWINDTYRALCDGRSWFGLMIRGQVAVPNVYSAGTVTLTQGSQIVTGAGTAFAGSMVNQQLRAGFSTGFYNIASVQTATQLTLDLPWGNASVVNSGFTIMSAWVTLGPNIKKIKTMVNQRQGYRMLKRSQSFLNLFDTWRTATGWTWAVSAKEPSASGQPMFELYPVPTFQQVFPYLAYVVPPDLVQDGDFPYSFIPSDMLILPAIANALVFRGPKLNPYYDSAEAGRKIREFNERKESLYNIDNSLDLKDYMFNEMPEYVGAGATWNQNHDDGGW